LAHAVLVIEMSAREVARDEIALICPTASGKSACGQGAFAVRAQMLRPVSMNEVAREDTEDK